MLVSAQHLRSSPSTRQNPFPRPEDEYPQEKNQNLLDFKDHLNATSQILAALKYTVLAESDRPATTSEGKNLGAINAANKTLVSNK
jgi:hypothetical protein